MTATPWDVTIAGAGPAGLAAAINASAEGLSTLVLDYGRPGGQAAASARIENYPGFPFGVSGRVLTSEMREQAERLGAVFARGRAVDVTEPDQEGYRTLRTVNGEEKEVRTRAVVVATGIQYRKLGVPGEKLSRVKVGATAEVLKKARGKLVVVIGGGNSAGQAVVKLASVAKRVDVLVRHPIEETMSKYLVEQLAPFKNVEFHQAAVTAIEDRKEFVSVHFTAPGGGLDFQTDADLVVVHIGGEPRTKWLAGKCRMEKGYLLTGDEVEDGCWPLVARRRFETSCPGIFAVGDVRARNTKRVASAVGEGATVVPQVFEFIRAQKAR